jgi:hypothetical protein
MTAILFYIVYSFYFRKYLFILIIVGSLIVLLPLVSNPYTYYILSSAIVEKEIPDKDGEIFIVKFRDNSSATIVYNAEDKICIGREYESKYRCRFILSVVDKYVTAKTASSDAP